MLLSLTAFFTVYIYISVIIELNSEEEMKREGNIKISSENMMPIIKKWLYSDKDIFLREIVANGIDAITKFKKLVDMGEAQSDNE